MPNSRATVRTRLRRLRDSHGNVISASDHPRMEREYAVLDAYIDFTLSHRREESEALEPVHYHTLRISNPHLGRRLPGPRLTHP